MSDACALVCVRACVCQCRVLLCGRGKIKMRATIVAATAFFCIHVCVCVHEMMTKPLQLMHAMIKWRQCTSHTERQRHKLICYNMLCITICIGIITRLVRAFVSVWPMREKHKR